MVVQRLAQRRSSRIKAPLPSLSVALALLTLSWAASEVLAENDDKEPRTRTSYEYIDNITNPYISGCLYSHNLTSRKRICNTDDPPSLLSNAGLCRKHPVAQYAKPEIRLMVQNFEASVFENWVRTSFSLKFALM